jgi:hypothetical protein
MNAFHPTANGASGKSERWNASEFCGSGEEKHGLFQAGLTKAKGAP